MTTPTPAEPYSTAEEIARLLKKSRETIYRYARDGDIPAFKVGREWRFDQPKVLDHLQSEPDPWVLSPRARARRAA